MPKIFQTIVRKRRGGSLEGVPAGAAIMFDNVSFNLIFPDSNNVINDNATFNIEAQYNETNQGQTETVNFGFSGFLDNNQGQADAFTTILDQWATTNSTAGTAPTNPTNAQGQNNGTVATVKAGGLAAGTSTLNLNIVAPILGNGAKTFRAYYANNTGVGDTFTNRVSYRQIGQGTNTQVTLPTGNFLTTPAEVELTNIDTSQPVTATFTHQAAVPATGGSTTVDAVGIRTNGIL